MNGNDAGRGVNSTQAEQVAICIYRGQTTDFQYCHNNNTNTSHFVILCRDMDFKTAVSKVE